jgi:hypothetical protein
MTMMFYGWSLWQDHRAQPHDIHRCVSAADARGCRWAQWQLEPDTNRVLMYVPDPLRRGSLDVAAGAGPDSVVLIPGPHEGLLDGRCARRCGTPHELQRGPRTPPPGSRAPTWG